jgi:hypothetical protein
MKRGVYLIGGGPGGMRDYRGERHGVEHDCIQHGCMVFNSQHATPFINLHFCKPRYNPNAYVAAFCGRRKTDNITCETDNDNGWRTKYQNPV